MHSKISNDCQGIRSENTPVLPAKPKSLFTFFKSTLFKSLLKLGLTTFFVILVNRNLKQNDFRLIIGQIDLLSVLVALIFSGLSFCFQLIRWQQILKSQSMPCHIRIAAKSMLVGFFLAFLTPGRIGEFFRRYRNLCSSKDCLDTGSDNRAFYGVFLTVVFGIISVIIQFFIFKRSSALYFEILLVISFRFSV